MADPNATSTPAVTYDLRLNRAADGVMKMSKCG
jgi:hypothetical protein